MRGDHTHISPRVSVIHTFRIPTDSALGLMISCLWGVHLVSVIGLGTVARAYKVIIHTFHLGFQSYIHSETTIIHTFRYMCAWIYPRLCRRWAAIAIRRLPPRISGEPVCARGDGEIESEFARPRGTSLSPARMASYEVLSGKCRSGQK